MTSSFLVRCGGPTPCSKCGGLGYFEIHRQGDVIATSNASYCVHGSTVYQVCDCRLFSVPYTPPTFWDRLRDGEEIG